MEFELIESNCGVGCLIAEVFEVGAGGKVMAGEAVKLDRVA